MNTTIPDEALLYSPLFEQMPGIMFIKNIELKYTSSTLRSANLCGYKNQHDKYGRNDYELKCKAAESAAIFQEQDNQVISTGKEMSFLQINEYADHQIHIFFIKKKPIINPSDDIIGVGGVVEEISNPLIGKAIFKLINLRKTYHFENRSSFQIDGNDVFNHLSEQESELIFYFIRGFISKEISSFMNVSQRTVDSILENIQNKFNCNSRNELLIYCLTHGFSNVIPQRFLQKSLKTLKIVHKKSDENKIMNLACKSLAANSLPSTTQLGLLKSSIASSDFSKIKLSKRQKECLQYLIEGYSTKEIARELNLSPRTIEHYIEFVKKKFGCQSRIDLIRKAT